MFSILALYGCGEWGIDGDDVPHDTSFHDQYRYYYAQECTWLSDEYVCGTAYSLTRSLTISLKVEESSNNATVYYDGAGPYIFWPDEYEYRYDRVHGDYFYQFDLSGSILTVYENGDEAIYSDSWNGVEYHYYYDIW